MKRKRRLLKGLATLSNPAICPLDDEPCKLACGQHECLSPERPKPSNVTTQTFRTPAGQQSWSALWGYDQIDFSQPDVQNVTPPDPPWPADSHFNCYREGWRAFYAGRRRIDCPFPPDRTDLRQGYQAGWSLAEARHQQDQNVAERPVYRFPCGGCHEELYTASPGMTPYRCECGHLNNVDYVQLQATVVPDQNVTPDDPEPVPAACPECNRYHFHDPACSIGNANQSSEAGVPTIQEIVETTLENRRNAPVRCRDGTLCTLYRCVLTRTCRRPNLR